MGKSIFEEMGGRYEKTGRLPYPLPYLTNRKRNGYRCLGAAALAVSERIPQGYIHESSHKRQAERYLADTDRQAQERFETLTEQMKQAQGITEQLKAENALEWVQRMNNVKACAREIVEREIIYT